MPRLFWGALALLLALSASVRADEIHIQIRRVGCELSFGERVELFMARKLGLTDFVIETFNRKRKIALNCLYLKAKSNVLVGAFIEPFSDSLFDRAALLKALPLNYELFGPEPFLGGEVWRAEPKDRIVRNPAYAYVQGLRITLNEREYVVTFGASGRFATPVSAADLYEAYLQFLPALLRPVH